MRLAAQSLSAIQPSARGRLCPARHCGCASAAPTAVAAAATNQSHAAASDSPVEWPGLATWRAAGVDARRVWGERGACSPQSAAAVEGGSAAAMAPPIGDARAACIPLAPSLVEAALQVLTTADPATKAGLAHRAWAAYCGGALPLGAAAAAESGALAVPLRPARPDRPKLVVPKLVPSPKDSPLPLSAHVLHNLAHIELNAIDLAMDTVARFAHLELPAAFYEDFARVADDESRHFCWTLQRLHELGADYGDMPAHDLLWEGAQLSAGDLNARLAIVPMGQEARGLDAGQRLVERLVGAGDRRSAGVVAQIALEERAHVAIGVSWFKRICAAQGISAPPAFRALLASLSPELLKGPFNHSERATVGLGREWYDVASWPEGERAAMVPPAAAAAAKGRGGSLTGSGGVAGEVTVGSATAAAALPPQIPSVADSSSSSSSSTSRKADTKGAQLEDLRRRLEAMLAAEAAAASL